MKCYLHPSTSKRSKIFPVLLVMSALAAETAFASWFPLRIGRRQSRATAHHPASDLVAVATQRRRKESQIHRILGRPTGNIRPPVTVLQKVRQTERLYVTDRLTDKLN